MFRPVRLALAVLLLGVGACVTTATYFPIEGALQAADRVIDEVWSGRALPPPPAASPAIRRLSRPVTELANATWRLVLPPAAAEAEQPAAAALELRSPEIRRLIDAMQVRFAELDEHYDAGAIGIAMDGYVVFRDPAVVPPALRNLVRAQVANENADRALLYREIALASGQPQWETPVRGAFAGRWIERAPTRWYVQERNGAWRRK